MTFDLKSCSGGGPWAKRGPVTTSFWTSSIRKFTGTVFSCVRYHISKFWLLLESLIIKHVGLFFFSHFFEFWELTKWRKDTKKATHFSKNPELHRTDAVSVNVRKASQIPTWLNVLSYFLLLRISDAVLYRERIHSVFLSWWEILLWTLYFSLSH